MYIRRPAYRVIDVGVFVPSWQSAGAKEIVKLISAIRANKNTQFRQVHKSGVAYKEKDTG